MSRLVLFIAGLASVAGGSSVSMAQDVASTYGTREPRTCETRADPASGPPTVAQATYYFICDAEKIEFDGFHLVTNVKIQVGSGRNFNEQIDSILDGVDPAKTIYPIRGTYTDYTCFTPHDATYQGGGPGKNCHKSGYVETIGACYQSSFGDWHCGYMHGGRVVSDPGWPPPMYAPPSGG